MQARPPTANGDKVNRHHQAPIGTSIGPHETTQDTTTEVRREVVAVPDTTIQVNQAVVPEDQVRRLGITRSVNGKESDAKSEKTFISEQRRLS